MRLVWAFTRDTHLMKPQECLEGDGVGFREALAEHMCLNLWNVHSEETSLLAPYMSCCHAVGRCNKLLDSCACEAGTHKLCTGLGQIKILPLSHRQEYVSERFSVELHGDSTTNKPHNRPCQH